MSERDEMRKALLAFHSGNPLKAPNWGKDEVQEEESFVVIKGIEWKRSVARIVRPGWPGQPSMLLNEFVEHEAALPENPRIAMRLTRAVWLVMLDGDEVLDGEIEDDLYDGVEDSAERALEVARALHRAMEIGRSSAAESEKD